MNDGVSSHSGIPRSAFPDKVPTYSGHFHKPHTVGGRDGFIRYVGSPYQVRARSRSDGCVGWIVYALRGVAGVSFFVVCTGHVFNLLLFVSCSFLPPPPSLCVFLSFIMSYISFHI